jgi:hypothetical protein
MFSKLEEMRKRRMAKKAQKGLVRLAYAIAAMKVGATILEGSYELAISGLSGIAVATEGEELTSELKETMHKVERIVEGAISLSADLKGVFEAKTEVFGGNMQHTLVENSALVVEFLNHGDREVLSRLEKIIEEAQDKASKDSITPDETEYPKINVIDATQMGAIKQKIEEGLRAQGFRIPVQIKD